MKPLRNTCPKCGRARADNAAACARCGLVYARWSKNDQPLDTKLDPQGEVLWAALADTWQDEAKHDLFVKHCAQLGRLAAAGMCYREYLDERPGDPVAAKMQSRIVGMATAALLPMRATPAARSRGRWVLWVVAVGAVGGVLAGLFFQALSG